MLSNIISNTLYYSTLSNPLSTIFTNASINDIAIATIPTQSLPHKFFANLTTHWSKFLAHPSGFLVPILVIIGIIFVLVTIGVLIDLIMEIHNNKKLERTAVLMEILPKETTRIKDTEALIRNIHALLLNTKMRKVMLGRPYMSFEIGATMDKIKFYIRIPEEYKDIIRERIYSTYPEVAIREADEDYLPEKIWFTFSDFTDWIEDWIRYIFRKITIKPRELRNHLQVQGTEMELAYHHCLSIKTNQEKDLLSSLLAGMKNLEWHQIISVQIQVRPLDGSWQVKGRRSIENFERDGKRPVRGNDFSNFFSAFGEQLTDGLDEELDKQGLGGFKSKKRRKTRSERKEIAVATDKLLDAGFETIIRVLAIGHFGKDNKSRIKGITAAFNELDRENRFKRDIIFARKLFYQRAKARRMYLVDRKNILTTSELSSFFLRLPGPELINDFPNIEALIIKEFAPPKDVETVENVFAKNIYRGVETLIGIKNEDLVRHCILQGITGTGKSEFIKSLMLNFVKSGKGLVLIEPHGKLANEFLELIPEERKKDVIYFDLFDEFPPAFNFCKVFKRDGVSMEDAIEKTTDSVTEIFKVKFHEAWSNKNEYYVENGIKTVIELQEGNILDIQRLFTDKEFRTYAISKIKDPQVKQFWKTEFTEDAKGNLSTSTQSTVLSVMYKLGKFLNSKKMLRSIAQQDSIDFKKALDENKIIIFKFSKEDMSEDRINFLGSIAIKLLVDAGFTRKKEMRKVPYLMVIDEAQNFISPSMLTILDELRKFGLTLFLMHQRKDQLNKVEGLADALYNNVGTMMTFTVGQPDAPYFEKIYGPRVDQMDLRRLPSRYGYCQLLVDGHKSETFNIYSLDRPEVDAIQGKQTMYDIKKLNREGRMHFKEIDKMLANKINEYKNLDENGESSEEFVEDYSDEYKQIEIANEIKKSNDTLLDYKDNTYEGYQDQQYNDDQLQDISGNPPFGDFFYEEPANEELSIEDSLKNIPVYSEKKEIVMEEEKKIDTPIVILDDKTPVLDKEEIEKLNINKKPEIIPEIIPEKIKEKMSEKIKEKIIKKVKEKEKVIEKIKEKVKVKEKVIEDKPINKERKTLKDMFEESKEDPEIENKKTEVEIKSKGRKSFKDMFDNVVDEVKFKKIEKIDDSVKVVEKIKAKKIEVKLKMENTLSMKKIVINDLIKTEKVVNDDFIDEGLGLSDNVNEKEQLDEIRNMWSEQKFKENVVINKSKEEDPGEVQGKNLWGIAKDKEKQKKGVRK